MRHRRRVGQSWSHAYLESPPDDGPVQSQQRLVHSSLLLLLVKIAKHLEDPSTCSQERGSLIRASANSQQYFTQKQGSTAILVYGTLPQQGSVLSSQPSPPEQKHRNALPLFIPHPPPPPIEQMDKGTGVKKGVTYKRPNVCHDFCRNGLPDGGILSCHYISEQSPFGGGMPWIVCQCVGRGQRRT